MTVSTTDNPEVTPPEDPPTPDPVADVITMTPQQLENWKARHRKGLQKELKEANEKLGAAQQLRDQVQELLESGLLPDSVEFDDFKEATSATLTSLMSEKERLEKAEQGAIKKLEAAQQLADARWDKYKRARVFTEVAVAAKDRACTPAALRIIQEQLLKYADVAEDENGTVTFTMDVTDENDHTSPQKVDVDMAVGLMEADVSNWGPLFNSTKNSGAGGAITVDGVPRTPKGKIDLSQLSMEQYLELEKQNPQAIEQALTLDAPAPSRIINGGVGVIDNNVMF